MELTKRRLPAVGGRLLSTRQGTFAVAGLVALVAGAVMFGVLRRTNGSPPAAAVATVLVAQKPIVKGASGDVLAEGHAFKVVEVSAGSVAPGAFASAERLHGLAARTDIYPGQQLTTDQFTASGAGVTSRIAGAQRAVAVPIDAAHGLVGEVEDGDRVDVLGAYKVEDQTGKEHDVVKAIARDILVLKAPDKPAAGGLAAGAAGADEQIVLRLDEQRAADIAFTAEYGKVWIALRPAAGAREARRPPTVTIDSLLFGVTPIPVHAAARLKHGPLLRRGNTTTGGN